MVPHWSHVSVERSWMDLVGLTEWPGSSRLITAVDAAKPAKASETISVVNFILVDVGPRFGCRA